MLALALVTSSTFAQKPEHRDQGKHHNQKELMKDLTAEEIAQLKTKRMTLQLDLTETQQSKMLALNLDLAKVHKARMAEREKNKDDKKSKPSKEERLEKMNEKLDQQIATKKRIKSILNEQQFEKWERMMAQKKQGRKQHQGKRP